MSRHRRPTPSLTEAVAHLTASRDDVVGIVRDEVAAHPFRRVTYGIAAAWAATITVLAVGLTR